MRRSKQQFTALAHFAKVWLCSVKSILSDALGYWNYGYDKQWLDLTQPINCVIIVVRMKLYSFSSNILLATLTRFSYQLSHNKQHL